MNTAILNTDVLKEKLVKEYPEQTQKFLFWLDGVEAFAPASIQNLCNFIHTSIEHDPRIQLKCFLY